MATIHIVHAHTLTPKQARAAAQKVADKIAEDYDMDTEWEGDVLYFERSGVEGALTLETKSVEVEIQLGFLMSAFAGTIEDKIRENIDKVFGA
ncbi:MAG: polyhydroxyalkanoic acid system family protein [Telluria sp.]